MTLNTLKSHEFMDGQLCPFGRQMPWRRVIHATGPFDGAKPYLNIHGIERVLGAARWVQSPGPALSGYFCMLPHADQCRPS